MSVTTETLRIVNEVVYKGKGEANKLKSDMQTTEKEVTKSKVSFDKLATAAGVVSAGFGVVAVAASKFYSTLKAGAEIQAAAFTFDNLTASIGSTSSAMLGDLQTATKGMISDLDLMNFASQTVAMGLGSTNEEVAALAELGSTLGAAFRGDAVAGMEEFNLLLANQSIPRLDSFGISAGRVRTRIAELQEQFPDMTREAAFTQAVLEEGQTTMANLGDSTDIAATNIAIFEASLKNMKDEAKVTVTEGFEPLLESMANVASVAQELEGIKIDWNDILGNVGFGPGFELVKIFDELTVILTTWRDNGWWVFFTDGLTGAGDAIEETRQRMARFENDILQGPLYSTGGSGGFLADFNDEVERGGRLIPRFGTSMNRMGDDYEGLEPPVTTATRAIEDNTDAIDAAAEAAQLHAEALAAQQQAAWDAGAALGDLFGQNVTVVENADALALALFESADAAGANAAQLGGLGVALGLFDEDAAESALKAALLKAALDDIAEAFANGELTVYEARDAYLAAQEEIGNLDFTIDTATGSMREDFIPATNEVRTAFELASGAVEATIDSIDRIPREVTVDVNVNVNQNGSIPDYVPGQGPSITSATGNVFPHGGYSRVGEFGPEDVYLPPGARVISTNRTVNNNSSTTINGTTRRGEQVLLQHLRRQSRPATILG